MREAVNVRAIRALAELRNALGRFAETAKEALQAAEIEIRRTQEWLREREAYWRREVERARWDYKECLRHQDEEWGLDCAAEKAALLHAEAELQKVQYWRARVERVIAEYRPYANRLKYLATDHTERARAFLDRRRAELEAFIAVPVPAAAQVVSSEAVVGARMPFGQAKTSLFEDLRDAIVNGRYQDAIDLAIKVYSIDTSGINGTPTYDSGLDGEGETNPNRCVHIGPAAFSSSGWLASSIGHEAVHARAIRDRGWPRNAQERAMYEVEAYDWEITHATENGLTEAEIQSLRNRREAWYNQLTPENRQRVDSGLYNLPYRGYMPTKIKPRLLIALLVMGNGL